MRKRVALPSYPPRLRRRLALLSLLALTFAPLSTIQSMQSDRVRFLVILREAQTDVSPRGITFRNCALILPDGRIHLESRVQQLPRSSATLKVFESVLDSVQFHQLEEILNDDNIKKLPPFTLQATPMMGTGYRGFSARIARGEQVQSVGYVISQGGSPGPSSPDDITKASEQSKEALLPLVQFFHGLQVSKAEVPDGKPTMCSMDADE
jgi:hypothetical protein